MAAMKKSDDEQHLQLLSIFHYVLAGFAALFACFPIFHFTIGIVTLVEAVTQPPESGMIPLAMFGLLFTVLSGLFMLFGWVFAILIALTGFSLHKRKRYTFCLVMAGVECIFQPFGTVLGVLTIIVLVRPSVKEMFVPQIPVTAG
jgi:hypothetical protein